VVSLRAKLYAPTLAPNETQLLQHINQALPETVWQRYRQLIKLRRQERLSEVEYEELLELADSIEKDHLRRMELLADLAALRGQSLDQVMHDLGITPMPYA
jgi:protein tyrosine/serine phosphatase